jgi:hypothetical protein
VLNDDFVDRLGAELLRDDEVFNSALVSFGSFGIIAAVAIETEAIYHLDFRPVEEVPYSAIKDDMAGLAALTKDDSAGPHHYEFVFDPYNKRQVALRALANKVPFDHDRPSPTPVWIVRERSGYALGDRSLRMLLDVPLVPAKWKTALQYRLYRKRAILGDVRATPGQLFTATISYFEGFTESALAVSIDDVPKMLDVAGRVIPDMGVAAMSQVRIVHPTEATLGFTSHSPKSVVFEFGLSSNRKSFAHFESTMTAALDGAGVRYTFHWSKNSGLDATEVRQMYGEDRVNRWRAARDRVFNHDDALKRVFTNRHLERAGLA